MEAVLIGFAVYLFVGIVLAATLFPPVLRLGIQDAHLGIVIITAIICIVAWPIVLLAPPVSDDSPRIRAMRFNPLVDLRP